ncbi:hypothetical protein [Ralstonia pseudosolanacearum]|uniref:hypothetical protein n=1 Tax=Ralstonia pseudosolanacearum TaxID=1310165 RepID=UPI003CEA81CF
MTQSEREQDVGLASSAPIGGASNLQGSCVTPPVVVLPPGAAPRRLTANVFPDTLYDHMVAFLNVNNPGGFTRDEVKLVGASTVGELMLLAATSDDMGEREVKDTAKRIKRAAAGTLSHTRALEMVSALFGYSGWHEARVVLDRHGVLANQRRHRELINLKLFDLQARTRSPTGSSTLET